ncbi:DUF3597 domain-containing protein [Polaromonas sp. YR568]|uniref:DUF3597 domain-containing protein n=1 Tax=Polaromonas sp. YR568 TaxID=1855301 RepID=UPI003137A59F
MNGGICSRLACSAVGGHRGWPAFLAQAKIHAYHGSVPLKKSRPPGGPQGARYLRRNSMGFFSKILDKLGFDAGNSKVEEMLRSPVPTAGARAAPASAAVAAVTPMREVDVVAQLEQKAAASAQKLNWRTSIVDLLKLLDIDSSITARKELATELGCPANLMGDSAQMNIWLHKAVLAKLAANGGNVPKELLD